MHVMGRKVAKVTLRARCVDGEGDGDARRGSSSRAVSVTASQPAVPRNVRRGLGHVRLIVGLSSR